MHEKIIILDFGGQYAHLIASRIRRENVLAEIYNPDEVDVDFFRDEKIKGIILSGGPQSVYDEGSAACDLEIFSLGKPVLGICYGHQFMNHSLGGKVVPGKDSGKEFGRAELAHNDECPLFENIPKSSTFWMSHGDEVSVLGDGFEVCAQTNSCDNAAVWNKEKNLFGIQFHPEVTHSQFGGQLLSNFINICDVSRDWTIEKFFEEHTTKLKKQIGNKNVILFVSGGVDSTVAFALLTKVLGEGRVRGLFVDNALLRHEEVPYVKTSIRAIGADLTVMREADLFLKNLEHKYEPEAKREIIGNTFLEVQRKFFADNEVSDDTLLAQGTIYPDTIESGATKNSVKIKTHHNRVPEIQKMIDEGKVIEPLADLYKDEVRALGELLGLPHELVWRHPFPGPGLGVRILCNEEIVTNKAIESVVVADQNIQILPLKSVGVQGDFRTYRHPAILEIREFNIPELEKLSTQIINQSDEVNRCLVCLGKNTEDKLKTVSMPSVYMTEDRIKLLQKADHIVTQNLLEMDLYSDVWQFPVVLVPISFNGKGKESIILRPINSIDAMSASVGNLPKEFFDKVTKEILEDSDISAVFLDITSKPPGTIEWE